MKHFLHVVVVLLCLFSISSPAFAAFDTLGSWPGGPCATTAISDDYAFMGSGGFLGIVSLDTYALLSQTQLCGNILHMYEHGGYLYVSAANDGLLIVDFSDPTNPQTIATLPGFASSSVIAGNKLYIASSTAGLYVYDISQPQSPQLVGSSNAWGYTRDIAVYDHYAYVAQSSLGLKIVDVADPAAMSLVGDLEFTNRTAVVVSVYQGFLYVGSLGEDGFEIFDLADPAAPQAVKYVDIGSAYKFKFVGNYLFLAAVGDFLKIYDITNPAEITELYTFDEGLPYDVAVNSTHVCLADQDDGLLVYRLEEGYIPTKVHSFDLPFSAMTFYAHDNFLYFPVYGEGLKIMDFSDPFNIADHGLYELYPDAVLFVDDLFYMSHGDEIHIVDNSDPAAPVKITNIEVDGRGFGLVNNGAYLYAYPHSAALDDYILNIIDISNPNAPAPVTQLEHDTHFTNAQYYQNYLYLLDSKHQLFSVNVSNPSAGSIAFNPVLDDVYSGFWMLDQYAYLSDTTGVVHVYDFTDPDNLVPVNTIENFSLFVKPLFKGTLGYILNFPGMNIIDFSDPVQPVLRGYLDLGGGYFGNFTISNNRLFVYKIIMESKIEIYDLSQPLNPGKLGKYPSFGRNKAVSVKDGIAYAATGSGGLRLFDFDIPDKPLLAELDTKGKVDGLALNDQYAYLAVTNSGLLIVDVTDPANPYPAGSYSPSTNSTVNNVLVHDQYAYLLGGPYNDVVDISDPLHPEYVGNIPVSSNSRGGDFYQGYLYIADATTGLRVLDISDPQAVTVVNTVDTPGWTYDLVCRDGMAFVADGSNHLRIYDLADPANPVEISALEIPYASVMAVSLYDHFAVLACDYQGIYFVDIADPLYPQSMGSIYIYDHDFNDVTVEDGYIYCTAEMNGVFKLGHELITEITSQTGTPDAYDLSCNYPNPFNPVTTIRYALPKPGKVRIDVYNMMGQHVKTLVSLRQDAGVHLVQWDGTDVNNHVVASGVYFYQMQADDFNSTGKMVLLK